MNAEENGRNTPAQWQKWFHVPKIRLWEAVALTLNTDPDSIRFRSSALPYPPPTGPKEFLDRLVVAERNLDHALRDAVLEQEDDDRWSFISLARFAVWARDIWPLPEQLEQMALRLERRAVPQGKWPWGDHETKLLRHLASAAHQFWSTYDPDMPSTAPINNDVKNWLVAQEVPVRVAEVIAQMLRPEDLPSGRRR